MKVTSRVLRIGFLAALGAGCSPSTDLATNHAPSSMAVKPADVAVDDALVQFSLLSTLAAGDYVDGTSLGNVLAGGDFGIGTICSCLDGEMQAICPGADCHQG
jgi:acetolactate decarboxylase